MEKLNKAKLVSKAMPFLAYILFLLFYFLNAGGVAACRYETGFGGAQSCKYSFPEYSNAIVTALVLVFFLGSFYLIIRTLLRDPETREKYLHFLQYFILGGTAMLVLGWQEIPMGSVALSSVGIVLFVPIAIWLSFSFFLISLHILRTKQCRFASVFLILFLSIFLTIGHYYLLGYLAGIAKEKREFFLEHCETENVVDNKMKCF